MTVLRLYNHGCADWGTCVGGDDSYVLPILLAATTRSAAADPDVLLSGRPLGFVPEVHAAASLVFSSALRFTLGVVGGSVARVSLVS